MMSHGETVDYLLGLTAVCLPGKSCEWAVRITKMWPGLISIAFMAVPGTAWASSRAIPSYFTQTRSEQHHLCPFFFHSGSGGRYSALTYQRYIPNKMELIDETMLKKLGDQWPAEYRSSAVALIEVEGYRESIEHQIEIVAGGLNRGEKGQYQVLNDEEEAKLWQARTQLAEVINSDECHFLHLVVDPTVLSQAVEEIVQKAAAESWPLGLVLHGSASHIHPVLLDVSSEKKQSLDMFLADLMKKLGGRLVPKALTIDPGAEDLNTVLFSRLIQVFDPRFDGRLELDNKVEREAKR